MLVYSITNRRSFEEAKAVYSYITGNREQEVPMVSQTLIKLTSSFGVP